MTTASPANSSPEIFLREHIGHDWNAVTYDPSQYGDLGEKIRVVPAKSAEYINGYQSGLMSHEVATDICTKLGELGIFNTDDFTRVGKIDTDADYLRVDVGNYKEYDVQHHVIMPPTTNADGTSFRNIRGGKKLPFRMTTYEGKGPAEGVTLLFKKEAIAKLMRNAALLDATMDGPLITTTGMEEYAAAHHPDVMKNAPFRAIARSGSLADGGVEYLNSITREIAPGAVWRKPVNGDDVKARFTLEGVDEETRDIIQATLERARILSHVNDQRELEVPIFTLQRALDSAKQHDTGVGRD